MIYCPSLRCLTNIDLFATYNLSMDTIIAQQCCPFKWRSIIIIHRMICCRLAENNLQQGVLKAAKECISWPRYPLKSVNGNAISSGNNISDKKRVLRNRTCQNIRLKDRSPSMDIILIVHSYGTLPHGILRDNSGFTQVRKW